jgi:uncharacterized membrane protein YciS (DUF1049 family)
MAVSAMSIQRQTTRGAILIGISVWLGAHALAQLDGIGFPGNAVSSLAIAGLIVVGLIVAVLLIAWFWVRKRLPKAGTEPSAAAKPKVTRQERLVTAEIVSLSALLICLSVCGPA